MHPCLCVDEIVRLITSELVAAKWKATTVALACCCKGLKDPALDAVWETQDEGFAPLLWTLPESVWDSDKCDSLEGLPTELEWARFQGCARRIRTLEVEDCCSLTRRAVWVLQLRASSEPLFPSLKSLTLMGIPKDFAPWIPLFLSPITTSVLLGCFGNFIPVPVIAPVIAALPILCPNLQRIDLHLMPLDPLITDAVLKMLLTSNQSILQKFNAGLPLTEEVKEVVCKLPNLRELQMDIGGSNSLPTLVLPNLTKMEVHYDHDHGWLQAFHGATLTKLTSITFHCRSHPIGDFLEAFESAALTTSIPATLSEFTFFTSHLWRPNYRSLLPFTQLKKLDIEFCCRSSQHGCPSVIDDDIITDLARAMPKLEILRLHEDSCIASTGITTKGLAALACYCPHLSLLSIHFQAASLNPSEIPWTTPGSQSTTPREDCALTDLHVSDMPLPEGSASTVARTLLLIFPHLSIISNRVGGRLRR